MKLKLPVSAKNWLSLIGVTIALISLFMIVFLFALTFFLGEHGTYLGLVVFILLPSIMVIGLLLIPIGMLFQIRKRKKMGKMGKEEWPIIDLNDTRHRNAFFVFRLSRVLVLPISWLHNP